MNRIYRARLINRKRNLRRYLKEHEITQADLAQRLGWTEAYVSQLVGRRPVRWITEATALEIERALNLREGFLDE
jgi:transcriptional regulator with XRE-family HTH domain